MCCGETAKNAQNKEMKQFQWVRDICSSFDTKYFNGEHLFLILCIFSYIFISTIFCEFFAIIVFVNFLCGF